MEFSYMKTKYFIMSLQVLLVAVLVIAAGLTIIALMSTTIDTSVIQLIFICGFAEIVILGLLWRILQRQHKE